MSDASWSGSESACPTGSDAWADDEQRPELILANASCSSLSRKRPAPQPAEAQGGCSRPRAECSSGFCPTDGDYENLDAYRTLSSTQKHIITKLVGQLDSGNDSVVITNPLAPSGPIVYVTNAWQSMCGYTMSQAVGENPRLTQGEGTDPETVKTMKLALTAQQPCRVRIINYRGYNREPFWNCLSVHPIFYNRKLVLFAARLQDYSHMLSPLVSLTPAQFCKAGDLFQMRVNLADINAASNLGQPRCVDVTDEDIAALRTPGEEEVMAAAEGGASGGGSSSAAGGVLSLVREPQQSSSSLDSSSSGGGGGGGGGGLTAGGAPPLPARHVKRLGFGGLCLEPEYLMDRLRHECSELELPCSAQEVRVQGAEVLRMEVSAMRGASAAASSSSAASGVPSAPTLRGPGESLRALVHVMPEDQDGTYSISLMRLVGDTFEFHAFYRQLRERLRDITLPSGGGNALGAALLGAAASASGGKATLSL